MNSTEEPKKGYYQKVVENDEVFYLLFDENGDFFAETKMIV